MSSSLALDPASVVWSVPETERDEALRTRPLLLLLHGLGSHERDLFSLVPFLPAEFVFASPRAPLALAADSFSWFPVGDPGRPSVAAAGAAVAAVLDWLDTVSHSGTAGILGFSQGGAMAVQAMRSDPDRFAAYVVLAGFIVSGEQQTDAGLETLRPRLFWGRDPADPVIPAGAVEATADWLPGHSTLTVREYSGIGHSISPEELADVSRFLREALL